MKSIYIAIKDLTRSLRSTFALMFMFVIPLLVTGMFYLMFGSSASKDNDEIAVPKTKVVVVNLDKGSIELTRGMMNINPGSTDQSQGIQSIGILLVEKLQSADFASLMEVSLLSDESSARRAIDNQQAGVAIIIPQDFSAAFFDPERKAEIQLIQDPTLTLGPRVVTSILNQIIDQFSGVKIAVNLVLAQSQYPGGSPDYTLLGSVLQEYMASAQAHDSTTPLLDMRNPVESKATTNNMTTIIGPIMGGMMIFFAFFTGGSTAQTILQEDEGGTLPRLFTTPTRLSAILGGKFLAVGLTVLVQVIVLLLAANLIFRIEWGSLLSISLTAVGIVACASSFGIFLTSLLKSTKQGGIVYGGLLTVTGMVGMMSIFTGNTQTTFSSGSLIPLFVPQGWAVRGLSLSMNNAAIGDVLLTLVMMMALSLVFFITGMLRFQKRYA